MDVFFYVSELLSLKINSKFSLFVILMLFAAEGGRQNGYSSRAMGRGGAEYDSCSSFMSSEVESTSCFDSEDDDATSRSDTRHSC